MSEDDNKALGLGYCEDKLDVKVGIFSRRKRKMRLGPNLSQEQVILVCRAFQEARNRSDQVRDTWEMLLSECLSDDTIQLFEEYVQLGMVMCTRALTPPCYIDGPVAITFSDGSEQAYGAVMYSSHQIG